MIIHYIYIQRKKFMFKHINGFEQIGEDIFVYKNFLSDLELNNIMSTIESLEEKDWKFVNQQEMRNKISFPNPSLNFIRERIISFLPEGYFLGKGTSFVRLFKGNDWGEHIDAHEFLSIREKSAQLKDDEPFEWADNERWGLVLYFNDFEGGELYYPEQNIEYKQKPGDLVIHSAEKHCAHGVRTVKSAIRYSHSNHIFDKIKVPI